MSDPSMPRADAVERTLAVLRTIPFFAGLGASEQARIAACARMQRTETGEVVMEQGDPPESLYAVATGKLKVVAPRQGGRDATLHILGPGDVFGEVALFQADGRTATIAAIEESVLLVIDRREFMDLLSRSTELSRRLLTLMATRLRNTIAHFDTTTSLDVAKRLAQKLLVLAESFGVSREGGVELRVKLSQRDLGDLVDSSRQTVNRQLRTWHEAGILETRDGHLVVRDMAGLRALAS